MTQAKGLVLGAAVAALTFGTIGTDTVAPRYENSLSNSDILVVTNDQAGNETGSGTDQSAKMGGEEGTHSGTRQGGPPDTRAPK